VLVAAAAAAAAAAAHTHTHADTPVLSWSLQVSILYDSSLPRAPCASQSH
jgi:hypothetical protein